MALLALRPTLLRSAVRARSHPGVLQLAVSFSAATAAASSSRGSAAAEADLHASKRLPVAFVSESAYLPSPPKVQKGGRGEDALCAGRYALGVADGVGGWSDLGVDAGEYARDVMASMESDAAASVAQGEVPHPAVLLAKAHAKVHKLGSTTVCFAVAQPEGVVQVLNMGDSGLQVWRHSRPLSLVPTSALRLEEAAKLWDCVGATAEQQHYFNCPYQLAWKEGDPPSKAAVTEMRVLPGDLVLAGTDGVWDNLGPAAVKAVLARFDFTACHALVRMRRVRYLEELALERKMGHAGEGVAEGASAPAGLPLESRKILGVQAETVTDAQLAEKERECRAQLRAVATMLAVTSQRVGADPKAVTPFSLGANKAGMRFEGGKLDDSAVVAALVVPDDTTFATFPRAPK